MSKTNHKKMTSPDVFSCATTSPKPQQCFIYKKEEEKKKILTSKRLKPENVWHFPFKTDSVDYQKCFGFIFCL